MWVGGVLIARTAIFLGRLKIGKEANKHWQRFTQAVISLFLQTRFADKEKLLISGSIKHPPARFVTVSEKHQFNQVELLLSWGRRTHQDKLYSSPNFCGNNLEDLQQTLKVHSGKLSVSVECVEFRNKMRGKKKLQLCVVERRLTECCSFGNVLEGML